MALSHVVCCGGPSQEDPPPSPIRWAFRAHESSAAAQLLLNCKQTRRRRGRRGERPALLAVSKGTGAPACGTDPPLSSEVQDRKTREAGLGGILCAKDHP